MRSKQVVGLNGPISYEDCHHPATITHLFPHSFLLKTEGKCSRKIRSTRVPKSKSAIYIQQKKTKFNVHVYRFNHNSQLTVRTRMLSRTTLRNTLIETD